MFWQRVRRWTDPVGRCLGGRPGRRSARMVEWVAMECSHEESTHMKSAHTESPHDCGQSLEADRLRDWIAECMVLDGSGTPKFSLASKRLRHRDPHPGPRLPCDLLEAAFPACAKSERTNVEFDIEIDSHGVREDQVRGVPQLGEDSFARPRTEIRITNLQSSSPLLDPENTGALTIFMFGADVADDHPKCRIWICRNLAQTAIANDLIGPVESGRPAPWGNPWGH